MSFFKSFLTKQTIFNLKLKILLITYVSFAILLLLTRIAVWKATSTYFEGLTQSQIYLSFLHGARFDFHVLAVLLVPLLMLFMLPYKSKTVIKIFATIFLCLFVSFAFFLAGDTIFSVFLTIILGPKFLPVLRTSASLYNWLFKRTITLHFRS